MPSLPRIVPSYLQITLVARLATLTLAGQIAYYAGTRFGDSNSTVTSVLEPLEAAASPQAWMQQGWNGLTTFAGAAPMRCFGADGSVLFDVAVLGAPFDTATTYRSGARFGPNGIRQGARRLGISRINVPMKTRVSEHLDVVDCGDVPMVYTDNRVALRQLEAASSALLSRKSLRSYEDKSITKDGAFHPRILTLGGDHTITLSMLRGIGKVYGPVSVIHFDSHIDTWKPKRAPDGPWLPGEDLPVTHDNYFWHAHEEGLLAANHSNIHVGIHGALDSWQDYEDDYEAGFVMIQADEIEDIGYKGIIRRIRDAVADNPVYISFDIDVLDLGVAPATGTPEIGGYTTREVRKILQGLDGLRIVGADIVEVAPGYDTQAEVTQIAAGNIGWDILALMAKTPLVA
ncbi:Arginase/deacetylase [Daedalea quercina L-15889]|uniref:Arginase/deacetylase n=1 Tax=Daedalea quercina L-15889 TaxID=1314783 RepID=A0A165LJ46_9APHY|nr:Arginase/deacetylase [Daedalea quercina L-15889]